MSTFDNLVVENGKDEERSNAECGEGVDDLIEDTQGQLQTPIDLLNKKQGNDKVTQN